MSASKLSVKKLKILQIWWHGSLPKKLLMAQSHYSHCMSSHCSFLTLREFTQHTSHGPNPVCDFPAGSHRYGCFVTRQRSAIPRWRESERGAECCRKMGPVCFEIHAALHKSNTLWAVLGWRVFHKLLSCSDLCFGGHPRTLLETTKQKGHRKIKG